jgi:hypothetical protein
MMGILAPLHKGIGAGSLASAGVDLNCSHRAAARIIGF